MLNKDRMPNRASKITTRIFYGILLLIILLLAFGGCYTTVKTSSPQQDCYYRTTYERLSPYSDVHVKRYRQTCDGDRFFFLEDYRKYGHYHHHEPPHQYDDRDGAYYKHWREKNYNRHRPRRGTQGRSSGKRGDRSRGEQDAKRNGRKERQTERYGE